MERTAAALPAAASGAAGLRLSAVPAAEASAAGAGLRVSPVADLPLPWEIVRPSQEPHSTANHAVSRLATGIAATRYLRHQCGAKAVVQKSMTTTIAAQRTRVLSRCGGMRLREIHRRDPIAARSTTGRTNWLRLKRFPRSRAVHGSPLLRSLPSSP